MEKSLRGREKSSRLLAEAEIAEEECDGAPGRDV
jgi:hypothetical protein